MIRFMRMVVIDSNGKKTITITVVEQVKGEEVKPDAKTQVLSG
jgi:ribulose bisphosphate carboxylase small subunit